jgi:hypothetical protein
MTTWTNWYFGTDTNNASTFPCAGNGSHFYIGRLGGGTTAGGTGYDAAAAAAVGTNLVSTYWDLEGPSAAPSGTTPYNWGVAQANAFKNAWDAKASAGGFTLFADIEAKNPGWASGNATDRQNVLHGFLTTIANLGFTPGVYISTINWDNYFGSSYSSPVPFVFWLAGTDCPSGCTAAQNEFNASKTSITRGGYRVMIWQYAVPGCTGQTQDLNITPYNGYLSGHWNPTT